MSFWRILQLALVELHTNHGRFRDMQPWMRLALPAEDVTAEDVRRAYDAARAYFGMP